MYAHYFIPTNNVFNDPRVCTIHEVLYDFETSQDIEYGLATYLVYIVSLDTSD